MSDYGSGALAAKYDKLEKDEEIQMSDHSSSVIPSNCDKEEKDDSEGNFNE